jgi:hypothetical protein
MSSHLQFAETLARRVTRREMLSIGVAGAAGLTLLRLLAARASASDSSAGAGLRGSADSCIVFFLEGGPSHIDLWDMKPAAPAEVRGAFRPISSSVVGEPVCEHLPMLSSRMHHLAQIRAVHHKVVDHNAGAYYMLTGRSPVVGGNLIVDDQIDNFPPYGSVLARLRPSSRLPAFVHAPDVMSNLGYDLPGQRAGFLGGAFDPLVAGDPSTKDYRIPGLELAPGVSTSRLSDRRLLLAALAEHSGDGAIGPAGERMTKYKEQALDLLGSAEARAAFDLSRETPETRERYGLPDREDRSVEARKFGGLPHLGQCLLLARRLIEAGVRLVTVCTGRRIDQTWDTHRDHFPLLKQSILPYVDRAFSALLDDLDERGMFAKTLVVAMGEFGRTPRLGQITSGAGAAKEGRDHWPHCYTVMMAGGGIRPGAIYGASDAHAAYPKSDAVTPEDVAATIYHALGIDPETRIEDHLHRPHHVALGQPIEDLFG